MKRIAIYLRVSTSKQDTDNQRRELELVAERSGWEIAKVYEDAGISGAKGRDKRPGLDAMMKAVNAKEFDMVAAWSVDRLGRSLTDLLAILQSLQDKAVALALGLHHLDKVVRVNELVAETRMQFWVEDLAQPFDYDAMALGGLELAMIREPQVDMIRRPVVDSDERSSERDRTGWQEANASTALDRVEHRCT